MFELIVSEPPEEDDPDPTVLDKGYELFVLRESLVDMAREGESRLIAARKDGGEDGQASWRVEKTYSWAEWGEKGARMRDPTMYDRQWVRRPLFLCGFC